jgi:DNA-binding NarL/FixJ family response regulator
MMMDNPYTFLVVSKTSMPPWVAAVRRALSDLGALEVVPEDQAAEAVAGRPYDLILVDAGVVDDAAVLVSSLRKERTGLRVIVFTSSPTWERARAAMQAGAVSYVRKSLEDKEIRSAIKAVLGLPPSGPTDN